MATTVDSTMLIVLLSVLVRIVQSPLCARLH